MDNHGNPGDQFAFRPQRLYAEPSISSATSPTCARVVLAVLIAGCLAACAMAWLTSGAPTTIDDLLAALVDCERRGMVPHTMISGRTVCYPPASAQSVTQWPKTPSDARRQP